MSKEDPFPWKDPVLPLMIAVVIIGYAIGEILF
jgi:hypothetical protein